MSIIHEIVSGDHDEQLDAIEHAVNNRKKALAFTKKAELQVGDKCRLVNLRPKYLVGAPCTVIKHNPTRIVVTIDRDWLAAHPQATKWWGQVTASPHMLEKENA